MRFLQIVDLVKNQLNALPLKDKAILFKEVLEYPIHIKDGVFYVYNTEYTNVRFTDYLNIREHWMSMQEFDKLFNYFENLNKKDK